MAELYYLDMDDCIKIDETQIIRFAGSPVLRYAGLIEAALQRPQSGYYGDLIEDAAALWESLKINRGFVDGNKRVGLACAFTFLAINGLNISAKPEKLQTMVLDHLEAGTFTKNNLDAWLRINTEPA